MGTIWLKDFATMREAEDYLKARGFSVGRLQGPAPRGIMFGDIDIQKWRNLDSADRAALHGWIIRYGIVPPYGERAHVTIYEHAPDDAHIAIRSDGPVLTAANRTLTISARGRAALKRRQT